MNQETKSAVAAIRNAHLACDYLAAAELAQKAALDYPGSAEIQAMDSHYLLGEGKRDEAAAALGVAVEQGADLAITWAARADLLSFDGAIQEAKRAADRALELDGDDWFVIALCIGTYQLEEMQSALALARRCAELYPDSDFVVSQYISALQAVGQNSEALAMLEVAERRFPDSPMIWHKRARVLMRAGKLQDAAALLAKALQKIRGDSTMIGELAMILEFTGQPDEAEKLARQALEINSCAVGAMNTLSTIYRKRGQDREAAEWHKKAKNAIPALRAMACLREANAAARAEDHRKVVEIVDEALPDMPPANKRSALEIKARALINLNALDDAEAVLNEVEKLGEPSSTHYELKAAILKSRGDLAGTVSLLQSGLAKYSGDGGMRAALLRSLHALGKTDEARALVEDTRTHLPQAPWQYGELVMALNDCGYKHESREFRTLGLEEFPDDELLLSLLAVDLAEMGDIEGARRIVSNLQGDMRGISKEISEAPSFGDEPPTYH